MEENSCGVFVGEFEEWDVWFFQTEAAGVVRCPFSWWCVKMIWFRVLWKDIWLGNVSRWLVFFFFDERCWFFVSTVAFCTPWWLINLGKEHCISEQVLHVLIKWGVGWPLVCGKYTGNARVAWSGSNHPLSSVFWNKGTTELPSCSAFHDQALCHYFSNLCMNGCSL